MSERYKQILVKQDMSIKEAIKPMNDSALQVLIVVDEKERILGLITDGDLRRAILNNISFNEPVKNIMNTNPITLSPPFSKENAIKLMTERHLKQIPIINNQKQVTGLILLTDLIGEECISYPAKSNQVFIMAGGKGTRLDPFTKILPKPLIPIGDKPIIEVIMSNFKSFGFNNFIISLNYKAEIIKLYFNENPDSYNISYTHEKEFLGTAGALRLAKSKLTETFIVSNCDVVIEMNFDELLSYHKQSKNDATIIGVVKNMQIPYGVIESNNGKLVEIQEKPEFNMIINSGVYVLEPKLVSLISEDQPLNMPDLLIKAKDLGYQIGVYPISSNWFDVGQWEEYSRALEHFKKVESNHV